MRSSRAGRRAKAVPTTSSTPPTAAAQPTIRQRGVGGRPVGNSSGRKTSTRMTAGTQTDVREPEAELGAAPGCVAARERRGSTTDSPTMMHVSAAGMAPSIQPIGLRGRCEATNAPMTANATSQAMSSSASRMPSPEGRAPAGGSAPSRCRCPRRRSHRRSSRLRASARTDPRRGPMRAAGSCRASSPTGVREVLRAAQRRVGRGPTGLEPSADDAEVALQARRHRRVRAAGGSRGSRAPSTGRRRGGRAAPRRRPRARRGCGTPSPAPARCGAGRAPVSAPLSRPAPSPPRPRGASAARARASRRRPARRGTGSPPTARRR